MGVTYFKRFRMEIDLTRSLFATPDLPAGYELIAWSDPLLADHADAKFRSFRFEIDANVFPCLGEPEGCRRLMAEISRREGFLGEATWLLRHGPNSSPNGEYCGTVQGVCDKHGFGAIQNLGITPAHRGKGLGTIMLRESLLGFRRHGLTRAFLEVTAQNTGAVRLYERLGFRKVKTVYKAADVAYA